jgi:hypothetical protein
MRIAIAECYSIDDCKEIAVQANAIAAYYKQIKDDESVRKFLQVKLRAWRRIGEILNSANVDKSGCYVAVPVGRSQEGMFNTAEYIRRIRTAFKSRPEIQELPDSTFRQALKLAEIPKNFFDQNSGEHSSADNLIRAYEYSKQREWETTPEGQVQLKEQKIRAERIRKESEERRAEYAKKEAERRQQSEENGNDMTVLWRALLAARHSVKQLDEHEHSDRTPTVLLLKTSLYNTLRKAMIDNRTSMQSIFETALTMWLVAHNIPPNHDK